MIVTACRNADTLKRLQDTEKLQKEQTESAYVNLDISNEEKEKGNQVSPAKQSLSRHMIVIASQHNESCADSFEKSRTLHVSWLCFRKAQHRSRLGLPVPLQVCTHTPAAQNTWRSIPVTVLLLRFNDCSQSNTS